MKKSRPFGRGKEPSFWRTLKLTLRPFTRIASNRNFWLIAGMLAIATIVHYPQQLPLVGPHAPDSLLGTERHAFERLAFLFPVTYAGAVFGIRGGMIALVVALAAMLPRDIWVSSYRLDAAFETGGIVLFGALVNVWFEVHRSDRVRRERVLWQLESAQDQLQHSLNLVRRRETELAAVNSVSRIVSESLDVDEILERAVSRIRLVIGVDVFFAFLVDESNGDLVLKACEGVSEAFASQLSRMAPAHGFNIERVLASDEPWIMNLDEREFVPLRAKMEQEGIRDGVIVSIKPKGNVMGALCVCARKERQFGPQEGRLLAALGNVVGVALDNARLFGEQLRTADALRQSERAYRELFENAHDAIIIQDLEGKILMTNEAGLKLGNYIENDMVDQNVREFLSPAGLEVAREVKRRLLHGEVIDSAYDQQFIRKDGSVAYVKATTSLIGDCQRPQGFQHIVRDVTEEKRLEDNLRFYLQEAARAQEDERKRIARDLHDETAQELVALSRELDKLALRYERRGSATGAQIRALQDGVGKVLDGVRRFSQDLRPSVLDDLGLLPALQWLVTDTEKRSGIEVQMKVAGDECRMSSEAELLLFRIAQEALRNVWRHSEASEASLIITFNDGTVSLCVRDNGRGFEVPDRAGDLAKQGKLGLAGIQERARLLGATLGLESNPGEGACITIEMPVNQTTGNR